MDTSERQNQATPADAFDELKKSEGRLREFIDMVPALAWCVLADGSPEFLNRQCYTYTGLSVRVAQGSGWDAAVHPDDLEQFGNRWRELLRLGEADEIETRLRRYDGEYRWFLIRAVPVHETSDTLVPLNENAFRHALRPGCRQLNVLHFYERARLVDIHPGCVLGPA